jgi:hypothetical protein
VTGAVNVAWKDRRVCVPKETFASNVSPPPKTFLILLVALCEVKPTMIETNKQKKYGARRGMEWIAHRVAFAVPDFGGSFEKEPRTLPGSKNNVDVAGLCCGVC